MKKYLLSSLMICVTLTKSLCQDPCPGVQEILDWDVPVVVCGSNNNIDLYVYTEVPNSSVSYAWGFLGSDCFNLPSNWVFISNALIGTITRSGQSMSKHKVVLKPTQFTSGVIQMRTVAYCGGPAQYSSWESFSIGRAVSTASRNISGNNSVCSSGTSAFSLSTQTGDNNFQWSASGGVFVSSQSGTTAQIGANGSGSSYVNVSFNDGCSNSLNRTYATHAGIPALSSIQANGQTFGGNMCNGQSLQLYAINQGAASVTWTITSGNASNAYLQDYGSGQAYFNSYINDCYGLSINLTNSCGTNYSGTTICVDNCFYRHSIYPNPASDQVTVQFDKTDEADALPDEIRLLSEKSTIPVKLVNVQEAYSRKLFKDGNKVDISLKDLPRGIYYIQVVNPRQAKEKQLESTRLVLE